MAAELYFLNKKLGGTINFNKEMTALFQAGQFVFVPFTASDTLAFDADSAVGEMHDRIIAGVARRINAILLTRDAQITSSGVVATAWQRLTHPVASERRPLIPCNPQRR